MATLVFSIETVGDDWTSFSEETRNNLTKSVDDSFLSTKQKEKGLSLTKESLSLSPFTGSIISIAMYDVERKLGAVYYQSDNKETPIVDSDFSLKVRTEKEILEDFWEGAKNYDVFVSFNGRCFGLPFLLHRSAMCGVKPSVEIARGRYLIKQTLPYHVDLMDEFSFYGSVAKSTSLRLACEAYGIEELGELRAAPELFLEKKFRQIAKQNAQKVVAIRALYDKWKLYLAPSSFINTTEF